MLKICGKCSAAFTNALIKYNLTWQQFAAVRMELSTLGNLIAFLRSEEIHV